MEEVGLEHGNEGKAGIFSRFMVRAVLLRQAACLSRETQLRKSDAISQEPGAGKGSKQNVVVYAQC